MKKIILFVFLISCKIVLGQEEAPEIFPQSPTVAELGTYGSYPVNLSTGLPQIEIPLYTIQSGDISIPVILKYHASGIKVSQHNSWVGLGWSLDTGGIISLEVRDTPDELEPHIYNIPTENEISTFFQNNPYGYGTPYFNDLKRYSRVKDAYHINLPTVSGSFFLGSDANGEVTTKLPPDKFRVEKSGVTTADGYFFKITDKMGMKYYFSDSEESEIRRIGYPGSYHIYDERYKSSYLLSKIEDTKGNVLEYTYGNEYDVFNAGVGHSQSISYTRVTAPNGTETFNSNISPMQVSDSQSWSYTKKLSEINFANGRIRFVMGTNPQYDGVYSEDGVYLDEMIVEKKDHLGVFSVIKRLKFFYNTIGLPTSYPASVDKYRFSLEKVVEISPNENKEIASFEYNTSAVLPSRNSTSIDYFGYFNGKNNSNLIPKRHVTFSNTVFHQDIIEVGKANRSIHEQNMKAGILTKITHPTKGYTVFDYEPNAFYGENPFQFGDYENFSMHLEGVGDVNYPPDYIPNPHSSDIRHEYYTFYVPQPTQLYIERIFSCECGAGGVRHGYAEYSINGGAKHRFSNFGYNSTTYDQMTVGPGNVTIDLEVFGEGLTAHLNIMYQVPYDDTDQNIEGFGLRLKSLSNFDSDDSFIGKKAYEYQVPDTNISSGKLLMNNSQYDMVSGFNNYSVINNYDPNDYTICEPTTTENTTLVYSSSSRQGYENSSVAYEYVTEYVVDSQDNSLGRTEYKFTSDPNFIVDDNKNQSLWINYQSKRSKLLKKQIFNSDNKLLTKEENFYSDEPLVMNYRSDFKLYCDSNASILLNCGEAPDIYRLENAASIFRTNLGLNWHKKDSARTTEYFYKTDGTLSGELKTTADYTYNNLNQEVQKITTTNSDEGVMETDFKYAQDLNNLQLIAENRIAIPLETKETKNSVITGHKKTTFATTPSSLYLPYKIFNKKGGVVDESNNEDLKLTFDSYENGNITQYHLENGVNIAIIWGYQEQYPIAKIENAAYSEVETALTGLGSSIANLQTTSNSDDDHCIDGANCDEETLRDELNQLRGALPNAMVTTFTYDPLIGVTSITDPKGYTMYYEYDDFNRLKRVKDADGKIISENDYHYKGQQ